MKKQIPLERVKSLKWLLIYVNCARAIYYYKSVDNIQKEIKYLSGWNAKSRKHKSIEAKSYAIRRNRFNECFKFPAKLIREIIKMPHGRHYTPEEIIDSLGNFVGSVINAGKRFSKDADGNYHVKSSFTKKYFINKKLWLKFMTSKKCSSYLSLSTMPCSPDLKKLIAKYYANNEDTNMKNKVDTLDIPKDDPKPEFITDLENKLKELVKCSRISVSKANSISSDLNLDVKFSIADQPNGFAVSNSSINMYRKLDTIVAACKKKIQVG